MLLHRSRLALVAIAALLVTSGCKKEPPKAVEAPSVLTVAVEPASVKPMQQQLEMTGSVAAWDPLPVMPAANGLRLTKVLAEEGDEVHQGQLLAQLDDATLQAQLSGAVARAQSAEAQLSKMRHPSRRQDYVTADASLAQAQANVASARDSYDRFKELQSEGGVSAADLVTKQAALNAAIATAEQARQRLSLTREGSRAEDIHIAEAAAAEARANVRQLQTQLAQTHVTAPAAGQIIKRDAHLGDVSSVGRALFQLVRDSRLEVQATIPENDMAKVHVGEEVHVTSDARPDIHIKGKVRLVSPSVDQTSRQATVKIDLPVHSGFQVGMFVRAQAQLGASNSLVVPAVAVVTKETGSEVFVLEGAIAHSRPVVTGPRSGGSVSILKGLQPGDKVVTAGVGFLKDGDKVDVAPALASRAGNLAPGTLTAPGGATAAASPASP
jgi:HlyD family secretion protein